jgi:hypothetical protein
MGAALVVLLLLILLFGVGGAFLHALWILLLVALVVWAIGFVVRSAEGGGRWYRW